MRPAMLLIPFLAISAITTVHAGQLRKTYLELKREAELNTATPYYQDSLEAARPTSRPEAEEPGEPAVSLKASEEAVQEMMKSWAAKASRPESVTLFYDFGSEGLKMAREVARGAGLDTELAEPVALEFLLAAAFERNPRIAALQEAWKAAVERYPQSLYLDNILQQYNAFTKQLHTRTTGKQRQKETVAMKFPFPGTLALKGDIISKEVEIAAKDYEIGVRDVMTGLRIAYCDHVYILAAIRITEENQKLLGDFESTARKKYEGGKATFNDVIKAQVELSKLSDDLITLQENRDTIVARINTQLNRDPQAELGPPAGIEDREVPLPLKELFPAALEGQQEIRRLELMIEKMDLVIALGEKMTRPDPTLGASYFEDRSGILAGQPRQREGFNPSPKLKHRPWFAKDDAYLREVRRKRDVLKEKLRAKKDSVHFEIKNTHFQLDASRRQRELYRGKLLPQAKQNLQTARIAYQGAKVSFLDLLDAERLWLNFNLALHRASRDYRKNFARLEQVIGKRFVEE